MPTSKNRSGHFFWKMLVPVPDGIGSRDGHEVRFFGGELA